MDETSKIFVHAFCALFIANTTSEKSCNYNHSLVKTRLLGGRESCEGWGEVEGEMNTDRYGSLH